MTITRARADRFAVVGFVLGVLCVVSLLAAYSLGIRRWPPGLEGTGVILYICTFPVSLVGTLLSGWGRFSPRWRGIAIAGFVLSLAAAITTLAVFVAFIIAISQAHFV